jgi:tape measure domain-containing protein
MANNTVVHSVEFTGDASKLQDACAKAAQAVNNLGNNFSSNSTKINSVGNSLTATTSKISSAFAALGATISVASFGLFIKSALQTSAQLEQTAVSFEVFTGSADTANRLLTEFKNQALNSPMQFQDITKGAQTLLGYGLTAQQVIPITKMLGDISGGNADRFNRLSLAFGQVNASGRLMGQEARQMINAGFNPLQSIAEKTGESMASLTQRMHDGKISVQEVANAFSYATSEGGRFFGLAERQAQTLQGKFNKLSESVTFAMADIGSSIANNLDLSTIVDNTSRLVDKLALSFINLNSEGGGGGKAFGQLINGALNSIALGTDLLIKLLGKLSSAFNELYQLVPKVAGVLDTMDNILIAMTKDIPVLGNALVSINDYFNSFFSDKSATVSVEPFKIKPLFDDLSKLKSELRDLNEQSKTFKSLGVDNSLGLQPRIDEKIKEVSKLQKAYDDYYSKLFNNQGKADGSEMTKAERKKYEELLEQGRIGYTNIHKQMRTGLETKLDIFDGYAKAELDKLREFGINTAKVEQAQYKMRQQIALVELNKLQAIVNKNSSIEGLKKSLAKMVDSQVESVKRIMAPMDKYISENKINAKDFVAGIDSTNISFGFDEARITSQADNLKRFGAEIYSAQVQVATQLAVGFSQIVGSVISGDLSIGDAFASLGAMFLDAIGGFLIQVGEAAIKAGIVKLIIESAFKGLGGGALIGIGMAAVAIGTAMQNMGKKTSQAIQAKGDSSVSTSGMSSATSSAIKSGSTYQSGSQTYGGQVVRLSIDLTGSITQTQSGYEINKSLETLLRVTGR